ncbi:MAG TPA: hypothetical protein VJV05_12480 [Pyrinomonadaceae bacterium]|nr:hypothetical protein [Pyrinomonadaceae bacterium]
MQHELLPKVCVAIALLVGAAGTISYFGRPATGESSASNASSKLRESPKSHSPPAAVEQATNAPSNEQKTSPFDGNASTKLQRGAQPESSTEAVYYCGAMTRKGTPCTRRVKTPGRCWQHSDKSISEGEAKQGFRR